MLTTPLPTSPSRFADGSSAHVVHGPVLLATDGHAPTDATAMAARVVADRVGQRVDALTVLQPGERWLLEPRRLDEEGRSFWGEDRRARSGANADADGRSHAGDSARYDQDAWSGLPHHGADPSKRGIGSHPLALARRELARRTFA